MAQSTFTSFADAKRAAVIRSQRHGVPFTVYRRGGRWHCRSLNDGSIAPQRGVARVYPAPTEVAYAGR